jgi:hypothetical protein
MSRREGPAAPGHALVVFVEIEPLRLMLPPDGLFTALIVPL